MKVTAIVACAALAAVSCNKSDASVEELSKRVEKLEAEQKKFAEVDGFVRPIMKQQKDQEAAQAAKEPDPNVRFAVQIRGSDTIGPADAPVTVVEAYDFACPYCEQVAPMLDEIQAKSEGKVRVVYKNFVIHPDAAMAGHLGGCAAGMQGKFREFKKMFWERGFGQYKQTRDAKAMGKDTINAIATELKLDMGKFQTDMDGAECKSRISGDMGEMTKFGVSGTPSFFVNGKYTMFSGPDQFKALIDKELKDFEKSGVPAAEYYEKKIVGEGEKKFKSKTGS